MRFELDRGELGCMFALLTVRFGFASTYPSYQRRTPFTY